METIEGVTVDPAALLPADQAYYHYHGSFTTPPCTEGVMWFVLSNPVELGDAQISAFEAIYDHNHRPVLPLNDRTFLLAASEAAQPATMPQTGGLPFPVEGVLVGLGTLTAAAGLYLRRRRAA